MGNGTRHSEEGYPTHRKRVIRPSVNWLALPRKWGTLPSKHVCSTPGIGVPVERARGTSPSDEGSRPSDKRLPALGHRDTSTRKRPHGDGKRRTGPSVKRYPFTGKCGYRPSDQRLPVTSEWGDPCLGQKVTDRGNGVPVPRKRGTRPWEKVIRHPAKGNPGFGRRLPQHA